jgi:predicted CopG family antitoxin
METICIELEDFSELNNIKEEKKSIKYNVISPYKLVAKNPKKTKIDKGYTTIRNVMTGTFNFH